MKHCFLLKKSFFVSLILFCIVCSSGAQNKKLDSLLTCIKTAKEDTNKANCLRQIGNIYLSSSSYDTTLQFLNKSLLLSQKLGFKKGIANCYTNIGIVCYYQANYPKALDNYFKALKIYEEEENKRGIGRIYNNLGTVYLNQSNYPKALEYFLKNLKIKEEAGDKIGVGSCYTNIGVVYERQANYIKALECYFKSIKAAEENRLPNGEIVNKGELGNCYVNTGNIYKEQSNSSKAIEYYQKALKAKEEAGEKIGIATIYSNIGGVYLDDSDYTKALEYFLRSLKLKAENADKFGSGNCYYNISYLYTSLGKYPLAILYADSTVLVSKETGDMDAERLAYRNLSEIYSKTGKYKEAYEYHVKFKALTDSIYNEDNSRQLGDLKTNFEVEKKEAELKIKAEAEQDKLKAIAQEEKKQQQIISWTVAGVLLIVIVFSALLYKRFRLTNKQKQIIELKEQETQRQNEIITHQKHLVEEKHKEISDSINYAERIQRAMLASKKLLDTNLTEYFIFFKPKDVVSGDFYWASQLSDTNFVLVTADSTGHGVPGAIMSMLNMNSLKEAVQHGITQPAAILNYTRTIIISTLANDGSAEGGKDGMDCSCLVFDKTNRSLSFAAAHNPVWIVRGAEVLEYKSDKMPVGKHDRQDVPFTQHEVELQKGDVIYTLTDGFPDQFGGTNGKKFMSKKLRELLVANSHLSMQAQKDLLETTLQNWVEGIEQVDDITIIGIRV